MRLDDQVIAKNIGIKLSQVDARHIDKLIHLWKKHFVIEDAQPLKILLATVVANKLEGDPLWLQPIGASSSGKTEIAMSFSAIPEIQIIGDLTPQSFFSGHTSGKSKRHPGLLQQMIDNGEKYKMLIFKDATTLISKRYEDIAIINSHLREMYDGEFSKIFGVEIDEKYLKWNGKIGVIMFGTQMLETFKPLQQAMGERFLMVRVKSVKTTQSKLDIACQAMGNSSEINIIQKELRDATADFIDKCKIDEPNLDFLRKDIAKLALFVAKGRQAVIRDGYTRQIEDIIEEEGLGRVAKQLNMVAKGLHIIHDGDISEKELFRLLRRVAIDSIPLFRYRIIKYFYLENNWARTKEIADQFKIPTRTMLRHLEDMFVIDLLERDLCDQEDEDGRGKAYKWRMTNYAQELLVGTYRAGDEVELL